MSPNEVKAKIILRGKTQAMIARKAGVHRSAITLVIQRRGMSRRLRRLIAREIGEAYERVWGEAA